MSDLNAFKKTAALANTISTRMTAWIETMERLNTAPDTANELLRADIRTALIDYDELLMETTKLPNEAHVKRALKVVNAQKMPHSKPMQSMQRNEVGQLV